MATIIALAVGVASTPAAADWSDSFPNGSPQQFWLFDSTLGASASESYFSTGPSTGGVDIQGFALSGTNIAYGIVPTDSFQGTGVVVRTVVNPTRVALDGPEAGVVAQLDTGVGTGYMATINVSATTGQSTLRIAEAASTLTIAGSSRILAFSQTNSYVLEFEALGPLLMARAYDATGTSLVAQASVFDSTPLVQGFAGVGVWRTGTVGSAIEGRWGTTSAAAPAASLVWTPGGSIPSGTFSTGTWSGTWTTGSSNWYATTGTATRWDSARVAVFGGNSTTGTAAGGTVTVSGSSGVAVAAGMRFAVDGYRILSGSQAPLTLSGTASPFIDVVPGARATISAPLAGAAGFRKTGAGALVLTGSNPSTGPTTVQGGTLVLGTNASLASSPLVRIDSGATLDVTQKAGGYVVPAGQTLAGTGTAAGATTIQSGATLSPGASVGSITLSGSVAFGPGGSYTWQMLSATGVAGSASAWDLAAIGGPLAITATPADPFRIDLWTLSSAAPDVSGSASNFNPGSSFTWTIATAAGGISGFAADRFRITTSATNGTAGFANAFGTGTFSVAQSGSNLNLVFTAGPSSITIDVASGTQTQSQAGYAALTGTTPVFKTGAGTLVLTATNTVTGSTTVQEGRLQLANAAALGSSRLVPLAGGTVTLAPALRTTVGGLAPAAGGLTDLGTGLLTVAAGIPAAGLVDAIKAGMGDGTWNGTTGITSSAAAASSGGRTVGWLDNGDGSVTAAFAAAGDTNLDWQIDALDTGNFLAGGRFDSGTLATWNEGDFTYDGVVDILDAASFLSAGLFDKGPYNGSGGAAVAAVPEPAFGWIAAGIAAWLVRRRRPATTGRGGRRPAPA